ncbi:MAG TPA: hypothetical protein VGN97_12715 [Mesorhizobium sp.]|jgi:hypothetical protein|nr:hypothetical protein [Mesorhizobium sp.]
MSCGERKGLLVALALILLFAILPILSVLASIAIADAAGCRLDEGGIYPCPIFGSDWGATLGTMFVLGWLAFLTLPIGALALAAWLVAALTLWVRGRSKRGDGRAAALD